MGLKKFHDHGQVSELYGAEDRSDLTCFYQQQKSSRKQLWKLTLILGIQHKSLSRNQRSVR